METVSYIAGVLFNLRRLIGVTIIGALSIRPGLAPGYALALGVALYLYFAYREHRDNETAGTLYAIAHENGQDDVIEAIEDMVADDDEPEAERLARIASAN
jgi:hypothetical protein